MNARSNSNQQRRSRSAAPLPLVAGWAPVHPKSSHLHAIPSPGDLGTKEPALCGVTPITVWRDREGDYTFRCHSCVVEFGKLVENNDQRLTPWDRKQWTTIYNETMIT